MEHTCTHVWVKQGDNERHCIVQAESGRVLSGPYPGGAFRPLRNQDGALANKARAAVTSDFNDGAYSALCFPRTALPVVGE